MHWAYHFGSPSHGLFFSHGLRPERKDKIWGMEEREEDERERERKKEGKGMELGVCTNRSRPEFGPEPDRNGPNRTGPGDSGPVSGP